MTSHNPFPVYDVVHRSWGPSVLSDVHTGGALMWIGGDLLMLLAMIPAAVLWVRYEDAKTKELTRGSTRSARPRPSRPEAGSDLPPRSR